MDNEKETKPSNIIEEALNDIEAYEKIMNENNTEMVKNILSEEVTKRLDQILKEDADDDEKVIKDDDKNVEDTSDVSLDAKPDDDKSSEVIDITPEAEEGSEDDGEVGNEWSEFDKYKDETGTYNMSDGKEEDVIKIFKLLNDDDTFIVKDAEVKVEPEAGKIDVTDKASGEEYIVDASKGTGDSEIEEGGDDKMMEIILNDKDENLEEGGGAGFQHGAAANHVGAVANNASAAADGRPHRKGAQKIEETIKEAKTLIGKALEEIKKSKEAKETAINETKEAKKQAEKIMTENANLKEALLAFRNKLNEGLLTNMKLGQIVKIITENTTSRDEKKQIVERFEKEAKTVEEAKSLCESITRELKGKEKTTISEAIKEDKPLVVESNKLRETPIVDKDIDAIKEMMHKLNKM